MTTGVSVRDLASPGFVFALVRVADDDHRDAEPPERPADQLREVSVLAAP
jgi:hypothetical protein